MKKNLTKIALIAMSVVILGLAIAVGTLAYLKDQTQAIKNVFVVGQNIDIDLTELGGTVPAGSTQNFQAIPGAVLTKDPTVTVKKGSEACYLFVKVETNLINKDVAADPEQTPDQYDAIWSIDSQWAALAGVPGVYYIQQDAIASDANDVDYAVLTDNVVTVSTNGIADKRANPEDDPVEVYMQFTAYAIQSDALSDVVGDSNGIDANDAWELLCDEYGLN